MSIRKETRDEQLARHNEAIAKARDSHGGHVPAGFMADAERKAIHDSGGLDPLNVDDKTGKPVAPKAADDAAPTAPATAKKASKKK